MWFTLAIFCLGQEKKSSGKAKMTDNSTALLHMIADALTDRLNLRRIIPPAMMPNMAIGRFTPPDGIQIH